MTAFGRRCALAAGLVGLLALTHGCDFATLAYFLMPETKDPATLRQLSCKPEKDKKDPCVLILTYGGLETRAELVHADRQLAELLAGYLKESAEADGEKLTIVPQRKVEEYKNSHPNWQREADLARIGRAFGADYIIYLEVNSLTLYEPGNMNSLFRGRANLTVSLIDVNHPDEPVRQEPYVCLYPSEARGPVNADFETPLEVFRQQFLTRVARELSWRFARHHRREAVYME
jgi:hypothetical protein